MKVFSRTFFFYLSLAALSAHAESPAPDKADITPEFIEQLVIEAQGKSPALAAANARVDSASAAIGSVRSWEDPMVTLGFSQPTARGFKASEEGNIVYGIQQKLPVFGRPELARQVAEAATETEKLTFTYEVEKLRRDLTFALVEMALADRIVALVKEDLGWLETMSAAIDHRYQVGKASQVEWLKIHTEYAKVADHLKTVNLEREHQQLTVNRLLNRDLHAPWPAVMLPAIQAPIPYSEALVNAAVSAEPRLKIMQQQIVQAEAVSRVTRKQRLPEIDVGIQARRYSGDGGLREAMGTVNFTLPWVNARSYDSDYRRDRARVRANAEDTADYTLSIREELHHLTVDLDAARRQALLYRDELIPLTEQTLASASAAWENNLGPFPDLLEAHRMLVDDQTMLAQAVADQMRKRAELVLRTGSKDLAPFTAPAGVAEKSASMSMPGVSK